MKHVGTCDPQLCVTYIVIEGEQDEINSLKNNGLDLMKVLPEPGGVSRQRDWRLTNWGSPHCPDVVLQVEPDNELSCPALSCWIDTHLPPFKLLHYLKQQGFSVISYSFSNDYIASFDDGRIIIETDNREAPAGLKAIPRLQEGAQQFHQLVCCNPKPWLTMATIVGEVCANGPDFGEFGRLTGLTEDDILMLYRIGNTPWLHEPEAPSQLQTTDCLLDLHRIACLEVYEREECFDYLASHPQATVSDYLSHNFVYVG